MKSRLLVYLVVFLLVISLFTPFLPTFALTKTNDSTEFILTPFGPVSRDRGAINGGVDLSQSNYSDYLKHDSPKALMRATPLSVVLNVPFIAQKNEWYCCPASTVMLLRTIGWYNRDQDQMAYFLNTTQEGTNAGDHIATLLNYTTNTPAYRFYWVWHQYNQIESIKNHIIEALVHGNPVIVNTAEYPGDVYIVGHDIGVPVYHYAVVSAFFNYGNDVTYVDPGYSLFPTFLKTQRLTITNLSYATGTRGYVY